MMAQNTNVSASRSETGGAEIDSTEPTPTFSVLISAM